MSGLFMKLFSSVKSLFPRQPEQTGKISGASVASVSITPGKAEEKTLFLPRVIDDDIILVKRPGDTAQEVLVAHLVPLLSGCCIRKSDSPPDAARENVERFAANNCFYFKRPVSESRRKWRDVCMESYDRAFLITDSQAERIPKLAEQLSARLKDKAEVVAFMLDCVLLIIDSASKEQVRIASELFSSLGVGEGAFKSRLKNARKTGKALGFKKARGK
ncbi:MAG: hypothetical protein ACTTJZ_07955 [Sphaerochaetaceae bacterium]